MRLNIGTRILLGFTSILVFLILMCIVTLLNVAKTNKQFEYLVKHDAIVIANAQKLQKVVVDMETGQRGFIITNNEKFLEPYNRGHEEFNKIIITEKELVRDNPRQVMALEAIDSLVNKWDVQAAKPEIDMVRLISQNTANAGYIQDLLSKGTGKEILDSIRLLLNKMIDVFKRDGNLRGEYLCEMIAKAMVDQETGERGFLITGRNEFLAPYYAGHKKLQKGIVDLKSLVANAHNRTKTTSDLDDIERMTEEWSTMAGGVEMELRRQVDSGQKTRKDIENALIQASGKTIIDNIRDILSQMSARFEKAENENGSKLVLTIAKSLIDQETGQRGFLITGKEEFLEPYENGQKLFTASIRKLRRLNSNAYDIADMKRNIQEIERLAETWIEKAGAPEIAVRMDMNQNPKTQKDVANLILAGTGKDILDQIREEFAKFIKTEESLTAERQHNAVSSAKTTVIIILIIMISSVIFSVFIALYTTQSITKPVRTLVIASKKIGKGEQYTEVKIASKDEIGELAHNYNVMFSSLQQSKDDNDFQRWLQTGQAELSNRISSDLDIGILGSNIISYVAGYLDVQIGTIYAVDDEESRLKLIGTHAYTRRKDLLNEINFGEGLAGQAALEKKPILITNCPDDYISVSSGLGDAVPKNIIVFPLQIDNVVKGVIELGSFHKITDNHLQFLEQISGFVAATLTSMESRMKANTLLIYTKEQAESLQAQQEELKVTNEEMEGHIAALLSSEKQLQAQQEELKVSNEELEEQTSNLKKSEEQLQAQEEELKASNEELEAKAITLKEQKDILNTKRREADDARNEVELKAEELERANSYKSEFLASMSHELRTPLNSLLILAKLLQDNKSNNLTEKQVEFARTIHQSGNDLLTLINDILDLSKVEAGKMEINVEEINVPLWIEYIEKTFRHIAEKKRLRFNISIADNVPEIINSDSARIAQIVKNLLSNAFKFTSEGEVSLCIAMSGDGVQFINNRLTKERTIAFEISDTGIGLSKEKQKIIFEAFQQADSRTSRNYGGTGLGLSISRELAKLLGGELHLMSEEGEGSTFTLYLPITPHRRATVAITEEKVEDKVTDSVVILGTDTVSSELDHADIKTINNILDDRREIDPGDKTVLIVDDDPIFLEIVSELAHGKGFKTLVAGDGNTGLHMADYYHPSAIILDIKMPEMNGFEVMKRLKRNHKTRNIPVHFISGADRTAEVLETGAVGLLVKPVSAEDIEHCFEKFESLIEIVIKKVLIVEDDDTHQNCLIELLDERNVISTATKTGEEAVELLKKSKFDCVIVDLRLAGKMSGFELANIIHNSDSVFHPPIIIYTGKDLSSEEEDRLKQCSDCIVIKGADSSDRLKDEVNLFLHKVEDELPEHHKKALKALYAKEESFDGKKVLIVDDDMRNVFALSSAMQDQGMSVVIGKNGRHGIEQLNENPDTNIILMDIMMPEMDGYDAMRAIRKEKRHKDLPIIALTAKAMKGEKERCTEAGASDYLSKPVDTERLLSLMRVWLHQK